MTEPHCNDNSNDDDDDDADDHALDGDDDT